MFITIDHRPPGRLAAPGSLVRLLFLMLVTGILGLLVTVVAAMVMPGTAFAASDTAELATSGTVIHPDTALLAFVSGSLMPLAVALVTQVSASSPLKATLNLILSLAAGVVSAFVSAGADGLTTYQIGAAAIGAYLASQVAYGGFWKPTGAINALSVRSAGVGLK